jgi:hypothetical protein
VTGSFYSAFWGSSKCMGVLFRIERLNAHWILINWFNGA